MCGSRATLEPVSSRIHRWCVVVGRHALPLRSVESHSVAHGVRHSGWIVASIEHSVEYKCGEQQHTSTVSSDVQRARAKVSPEQT
mmetsp:Transcript_2295/g.6220  ORF Transcript_2295/g.6220 Transcript_2295/m.6220 type:complete len:85 (+) Transcript_2295:75-329(+)